jgi:hypothetical protein
MSISSLEKTAIEQGLDISSAEFQDRKRQAIEAARSGVPRPELPDYLKLDPEMQRRAQWLHGFGRVGNLLQNAFAIGALGPIINLLLIVVDTARMHVAIQTFENNPYTAWLLALVTIALYTYLSFDKAAKHYAIREECETRPSLRILMGDVLYFIGVGKGWTQRDVSPSHAAYNQARRVHGILRFVIFIALTLHAIEVTSSIYATDSTKLMEAAFGSITGLAVTMALLIGLESQINRSYITYQETDGHLVNGADFLSRQQRAYSDDLSKAEQRAYKHLLYQEIVQVQEPNIR